MKRTKLLLLILVTLIPMMVNADPVEINGIYYNLVSKIKEAEVIENKKTGTRITRITAKDAKGGKKK